MSTLKELNALSGGIEAATRRAAAAKYREKELAEIRNGDKPLMQVCGDLMRYSSRTELLALIYEVINEYGPDLLRIAEMRQEALARRASCEAKQKRAALAIAVDPEPEGGAA